MRHRDFFAFCASLKAGELKTVNQLSWIRHLAEGEILYSPGEPGNALYVINRGTLEMMPPQNRQNTKSVIFGRGDIVGDLEVFADTRRAQIVRATEPASLQCFPRANFPELLRLVPSFFIFTCEQLALRSLQERDLANEQDEKLELSGRISNFDLTTIHQTVMSSGQTGKLKIRDGDGKAIGAFFFETGRLCAGRFQHLSGDEAFWQLFQVEKFPGTFTFSVGDQGMADYIQSSPISHSSADILITALQFRDELDALKKGMQHCTGPLSACTAELHWNGAAPEYLKPLAEQIWGMISAKPRTMRQLYRECSVCELKLYEVVSELHYSGQISFGTAVDAPNINILQPIPASIEASLPQFPSHTSC